MMNMNCKCKRETLTVPRGNDFKVHLCRKDVAPGNSNGMDFRAIDNLEAFATKEPGMRLPLEHKISADGDIVISVNAEIHKLSTYGIEMTGTYHGHNWRWKCCEVFRLSDCSCESTVKGMESFDVETYYIWDSLDFDIKDDTMLVTSDGHADIVDGTLILQATDTTDLAIEGDAIVAITND